MVGSIKKALAMDTKDKGGVQKKGEGKHREINKRKTSKKMGER